MRITHNRREVRRGNPLVEDIVKVDVAEERMPLDLLGIGFTGTKTTSRVAREELGSQPTVETMKNAPFAREPPRREAL